MDIGVRELKQRLSEILELASQGELIRVTDRGRAKAIIGPVPGMVDFQAGIDAGWLTPAATTGTPHRVKRQRASARINDVLTDDRGT